MNSNNEWNEFLESLINDALKEYQNTREFEFLKEKQEQINARLLEAYPEKTNPLIYELAFETGLDEERKNEFVYRQGMKDCIFLLKELGVLA